MYVQLTSVQHIEINGVQKTFRPGQWVDVGKQTAMLWISSNQARPIEATDYRGFIPGESGIVTDRKDLLCKAIQEMQVTIFEGACALQFERKHMALVMDEFGAVEGLVTVTDMLEALVGHLPADASDAASAFVTRADGSWLIEGSAAMDEVMSRMALDELPAEEAGAYHTLGGFVMARLGRVPKTADYFDWGGMHFEVVDMDGRRIDKVLVHRVARRGPDGRRDQAGA